MGQAGETVVVDRSVGYVLKRAHAALRTEMDAVLRPLELTVPQYACLELLSQRPGLSNAELARGAFVTRQSTNIVLRGLENRGLVTRPQTATRGRALPTDLTHAGLDLLEEASAAVRLVEQRMTAAFDVSQQRQLHADLTACVEALGSS